MPYIAILQSWIRVGENWMAEFKAKHLDRTGGYLHVVNGK
jgi:hypothetical protein